VRSGAALALVPDAASPEAIGDAVRALLEDGSYRQAARDQAATIAAMPSPEEVVGVLERLS
jgi:UDP:flavonoid glycosyltransferase YjiC (YdhE family)